MTITNEELKFLARFRKSEEGNEFITFLENQYVIYLTNILKVSGEELIVTKGKAMACHEIIAAVKNAEKKLKTQSSSEALDRY